MTLSDPKNLLVSRLGPARFRSPFHDRGEPFVDEERRVLAGSTLSDIRPYLAESKLPPAFEAAGPRADLYFDPSELTCGIVTCGGLCPGLNDVIRSLVLSLTYGYGVREVLGFRYGYSGLNPAVGHEPLVLTPKMVARINQHGGTVLGSSRGPQDLGVMIDALVARDVRVLFAIGGDGTLRGASALSREASKRGVDLAVIGVPKTIDNDLNWVYRSFGFATAVEEACRVIVAAHAEARGAWNGIGLVKIMGRYSGSITAEATLANSDVNFCLIPEVPFTLDGEGGFIDVLHRRLEQSDHAVVVVAEGAGQDQLRKAQDQLRKAQDQLRESPAAHDPSGNLRLGDIGLFLRDEMKERLLARGMTPTVKYIDPSYAIRGVRANAVDSEYCLLLGQHAAHAGLAGRTDMVVGYWNQCFTHVPIDLVVTRREVDPHGEIWQRVLEATGQPASMVGAGTVRAANPADPLAC